MAMVAYDITITRVCGCAAYLPPSPAKKHGIRHTTPPKDGVPALDYLHNLFFPSKLHPSFSYLLPILPNNMLEFFTYKKVKKHKAAKQAKEEEQARKQIAEEQNQDTRYEAAPPQHPPRPGTSASQAGPSSMTAPGRPVLDRDDESFLETLLSEDGPTPPLPDRVATPELEWPSDDASSLNHHKVEKEDPKGKAKATETKPNRLSMLFSKKKKHGNQLSPEDATNPQTEEQKEANDINRVLDRLNLSAKNNKVINLSNESTDLLSRFTQIFKDLANGVPTAYDDLIKLISDRDGAISKGFEKLPSGLQKLVMQLPDKLTSSIAPEILAAAAKSQGLHFDQKAEGGLTEAGKKMFVPQNLLELLTKPGAVVGMLRAIVTALRARWPAFIGMNVIWSVSLFCKLPFANSRLIRWLILDSAYVCALVLLQTWP